MFSLIKKDKVKEVLIVLAVILSIPLIGVITNVIFTYGNYVGTYARQIVEEGMCSR